MSAQPQSSAPPSGPGGRAVHTATARDKTCMTVPIVGMVEVPSNEELVFVGGVGVLAVAGVLDWPIATLLVVGHLLSSNRRLKILRDFGEVLEEA